jgi:hypothetical protein
MSKVQLQQAWELREEKSGEMRERREVGFEL